MLNVIKCVLIIIGTIIGAGFASGQEIATFFNRYGSIGVYGIALSCILFGIIIVFVFHIMNKKEIENILYKDSKILKMIQQSFLGISFCIMIAGIGAFFEEQFKIYHLFGALFGALICYIVFSYEYKGLELFNIFLVPGIIVGVLFIGMSNYDIFMVKQENHIFTSSYDWQFLLSSILYVGYNSLVLVPILLKFKIYNLSQKQKYIITILSTGLLLLMGVSLFKVINIFYPSILEFEIPTLQLASMKGVAIKFIYGIILLFAIFTTAISSGFAFLESNKSDYNIRNFLLCVIAFLISDIGFSNLVNSVFPVFGYIGIVLLIVQLKNYKNSFSKRGKKR